MLPLRNQLILNDLGCTKVDGIATTTCNWTEGDLSQTSVSGSEFQNVKKTPVPEQFWHGIGTRRFIHCGPPQPETWDHSAKAMAKPFETEFTGVVAADMPSAAI